MGVGRRMSRTREPLILEVLRRRTELGQSGVVVSVRAGLDLKAVARYETSTMPLLHNFEAIVNTLGGRLKIEWGDAPKEFTNRTV